MVQVRIQTPFRRKYKDPVCKKHSYINIIMLLRVIGWLLMIEAAFMLFPLISSIIYKTESNDIIAFLISIGATVLSGIGMVCLRTKNKYMGKREAILLVSLIWVIFSLYGMLPFLISGTHMSVTDAFFETMSGFTTTGASVLASMDGVPRSLLLWRSVIQWLGGLGIILFTLAVLPMLNYQGGIQLFNAEVTGITHDKLRPRVSSTAKGLWMIYICLTFILIILLSFSDMNIFEAICHGLSTMSTGGFSTNDMNIMAWDSYYVKIVVSIFMLIGGVNFALLYKIIMRNFRDVGRNDAFKWYLGFIFIAYAVLAVNVVFSDSFHNIADVTIDPLFQAVSIISSTGLTEPDFSNWGPIAIVMLVIMMFLGACAGSTSGGAKIDRLIVLFKFLRNEFFKVMHPNAVTTVRINGNGTSSPVVQKVLAFLFLYILIIFAGGIFLIFTGMSLHESFFCSLSAISNTGLGTDTIGGGVTYAEIPSAAKWILSFIMLTGRLEIYTVLLLFTTSFWRK